MKVEWEKRIEEFLEVSKRLKQTKKDELVRRLVTTFGGGAVLEESKTQLPSITGGPLGAKTLELMLCLNIKQKLFLQVHI